MTRTKSTFLALIAVLLSPMAANAVPILVNGSLTGPIANTTIPTGWSVILGTPDTMDQDNNVGVVGLGDFVATPSPSPDGGTWIGFARNGELNNEIFGQLISGFDIGESYELGWYHGNFGFSVHSGANAIEVLLDGLSIGSGAIRSVSEGWLDEMISFSATAETHRIDFRLLMTDGSYHSIDGIRLGPAESVPEPGTSVPEPGTLALLGIGLFGMGLARRRKKV